MCACVCVCVCVCVCLNDSALKAEMLCLKKKPIFFLRELYFIRLTLDNWIAKNDSSFVDVCIHGYVCVCARMYFRSRSFASRECQN